MYFKYASIQTNNSLLREYKMEYKTEWFKKVKLYMDKVEVTQEQLFTMSKEHIKKKIDEWELL